MRVCFYTESALPMLGGQEFVVDALARRFVALGHEAMVLAPWPRGRLQARDDLLPYRVMRHPRFISTRRFLDWYGRYLARAHRRFRFDVLHCHSVYPAGYVAARCAAIDDVPVVITSHCGDICPSSRLLHKPGLPARFAVALERADAAIAITGFTEKRLRELSSRPCRIVRLPNGVDVDKFSTPVARPANIQPAIRPGSYVLFLGRLAHRKGADLLIDAMALVQSDRKMQLVIAGDGPEAPALRCGADALRTGDRVHFVGDVHGDVKTWLFQNAVCTVIPSRISEGFPLVLLESCAAGRPVIGTRVPGLSELIFPDRTGLLVAPESPAELAEACSRLITDRELSNRLGTAARRFAQQHDWGQIAQSHLALFEELAAQRRESTAA